MTISTASTSFRASFRQNILLQLLIVLFIGIWLWTLIKAEDINNWLLENIMVGLFAGILALTYQKFKFSDLSYLMFFIFLPLHMYGAAYVYAHNPLGEWLQATFHTSRNPYDRLVHFSFGFLLAYPMRDLCLNYIKTSPTLSWILPVVFSLACGAFYEIVEWILAAGIFPKQSTDFLGLQGDQWDAQKDMVLAFIGSFAGVTLVSIGKKIATVRKKTYKHSATPYMSSR